MAALEGLQPERVFCRFEEISRIPRGSGNTDRIADYLVSFAKEKGLDYSRDEANNVIIRKAGTPGYEDHNTVILQGHSDMVCEKEPGSSHDFEKDPLDLAVKDGFISAEGTTLGGDDGIAAAMMLAILESDDIPHPPLEALITSDEEIGLLGAQALDYSLLSGRTVINLDSEDEGIIVCGCAGGLTGESRIPVRYEETEGCWYEIAVTGLQGGHSGSEVLKNRASALVLGGRMLYRLQERTDMSLAELSGGNKDNAIPRSLHMTAAFPEDPSPVLKELEAELLQEYRGIDEDIRIECTACGSGARMALHPVSLQKITFFLMNMPYGLQKMSGTIEGLAETSCNPGILRLTEEELCVITGIRSSLDSARAALSDKFCYLTEFLGGDYTVSGGYPAWEYDPDAAFPKKAADLFEEMYGRKAELQVIHAGLECGIICKELGGAECISIGPDMKDIHTTEEVLSVESTKRVYEYVLELLKQL